MATLWITEHDNYTAVSNGQMTPVPGINGTTQTVTTSATSAQSSALAKSTVMVELYCDTAVHLIAGSNPTATTSHKVIPAGTTMFYDVKAQIEAGSNIIAARTVA